MKMSFRFRNRSSALLVGCGAMLGAGHSPINAQIRAESKAPTELLEGVRQYHRDWIERDATVDACSFYRLMQTPTDRPKQLPVSVKTRVGSERTDPCEPTTKSPAKKQSASVLRYDSTSVSETTAKVYVTVINGENVHREDFTALFLASDHRWAVREVRVWGALRVYRR